MKRISRLASTLALAVFGSFLACSAGTGERDDSSADPIQGGTADSGHPGVGLVWFQGGGFCTGTLVTPSVVLTAGHCVQDPIDGFYTGAGSPTTQIGANPVDGMTKHAVDKMIAHPSYSASGGCPNTTFDIGLIHLAAPLTGVATTPYAKNGAPATGTTCTAVGYGTHTENGQDQFEQKRTGTEIMQDVQATSVMVKLGTALADHGDSGGPLICNGVIAGATSCHTDGDWPAHQLEHYARIDAASAWIDQQIQAWGGGGTDGGTTDSGADTGTDAGTDGGPACAHSKCASGTKLVKTCDACVAKICAADAYCCSTSWDSICVGEVQSVCNESCGGGTDGGTDGGGTDAGTDGGAACTHPICTQGSKLATNCDVCVGSICAKDPYCCSTAWDSVCVGEVKSVCNKSCK
jgi:Trypsin